jgi:hypothetical protein
MTRLLHIVSFASDSDLSFAAAKKWVNAGRIDSLRKGREQICSLVVWRTDFGRWNRWCDARRAARPRWTPGNRRPNRTRALER